MERIETTLQRIKQRGDGLWGRFRSHMQDVGLMVPTTEEPAELEDYVEDALRPVRPSAAFRQNLGSNLQVAARGQISGLAVEYPRPFREGIILGVGASLFILTITVLVLALRSRATRAD